MRFVNGLCGEGYDVAVTKVVGSLGAEASGTLYHGVAGINELLSRDEAGTVVTAHAFQFPLLEADDKVIVLRIPVVEGRDVQAAIEAVDLSFSYLSSL